MNIKKYFQVPLMLYCFLAVIVTACKTKEEIKGTMKLYENQELFSMIVSNTVEYETLSGKMKTTLRLGKNNVDVSALLKIIKDDKLLLSFQMPIVGSEMFRFALSKDSLMIIDRMNKQFAAESIENVRQSFSFDFNLYNLQSLFTNQLFLAGKNDITMADYSRFIIEQNKEVTLIKTVDKNINYTFSVDYTDHIRNSTMTGNSNTTTMNWSYDNFSELDNKQLFPMQIGVNLKSPSNQLSVSFSFSKIDLNKEVEIDFNIPKKYNRITLAQAMTLINSMKQ